MKSSIFPLDHGSNKLMKSEYFLHFFIKKENKEKFTKKLEEDRRKKKSDYYLLPEKFFYYTNSNTLKSISSKQNRFHMRFHSMQVPYPLSYVPVEFEKS